MKTIEQAAAEYAERCTLKAGAERTKREISFKAGAEFAQRWISTKEELPDNSDEQKYYLIKYDEGYHKVNLSSAYRNNRFWSAAWCEMSMPDYWRLIEIKYNE